MHNHNEMKELHGTNDNEVGYNCISEDSLQEGGAIMNNRDS